MKQNGCSPASLSIPTPMKLFRHAPHSSRKLWSDGIRTDRGTIALADIYIQDVSGLLGRSVTITKNIHREITITGTSQDVHGHFILFNMTGDGKYVRRDRFGKDRERRFCSTWSLGNAFGRQVDALLCELT